MQVLQQDWMGFLLGLDLWFSSGSWIYFGFLDVLDFCFCFSVGYWTLVAAVKIETEVRPCNDTSVKGGQL